MAAGDVTGPAGARLGSDPSALEAVAVQFESAARFLRAGTNVVGSSFVWLVAPDHTDAWLRDPLEKACRDGNSTLYI
ncbi:MAG TPA: hypothetical protein PKE05_15530, partial [Microthrixaceae bacterium]|nr:hypothetical protein [Microthrixaceae bacterium]